MTTSTNDFVFRFTVPQGEYEGATNPEEVRRAFVADVQALLYDFGEGATRSAVAGSFTVDRDEPAAPTDTIRHYVLEYLADCAEGYVSGQLAEFTADDAQKGHHVRVLRRLKTYDPDALRSILSDHTDTSSGAWSGLIYTYDVLRLAAERRESIAETLENMRDSMGVALDDAAPLGLEAVASWGEVLATVRFTPLRMFEKHGGEGTGYEIAHPEGEARERAEEVLSWAVRAAVENHVHELANELIGGL